MSMFRSTFNAVAALAGTIGTTANTATKLVNTGSSSVDMLNTWIDDAKAAQQVQSEFQRETVVETVMMRHQSEVAEQRSSIKQRLSSDADLAKAYKELDPIYQKARARAEARLASIYGDQPQNN